MGPSSSDPQEAVKRIFEFFGWPEDKQVSEEEYAQVRALLWKERKAQERKIHNTARDPKLLDAGASAFRQSTESPIEEILFLAMGTRSMLFGRFVSQHRVGPYMIDLAFPDVRLAVECDGRDFHSSPADMQRDRRKTDYLARLGWTVLRFTGSAIYRNPHTCVDEIQRNYERLMAERDISEPWEES